MKQTAAIENRKGEKQIKQTEAPAEKRYNSREAEKRSQLPVAFAYFLTLLLSLVIFGLIGFYIINRFVLKEDEPEQLSAVSNAPSAGDRFSVFYIQTDDNNVMQHGLLVRFLPDEGKIRISPVPAELLCDNKESGPAEKIGDIYAEKGPSAAKNALEDVYGMKIEKYMTVTNGAFDGIVDYVGGVTHTPTENMFYSDPENGEEISCIKGEKINLTHYQLRMYINYPTFANGRGENMKAASELLQSLINDAFMQIEMLENNMDNIFSVIYNNSDTNMTRNEYISSKKGLLYIMKNYTNPCESMTPLGTWAEDNFKIDESFPEELKNFFEM